MGSRENVQVGRNGGSVMIESLEEVNRGGEV